MFFPGLSEFDCKVQHLKMFFDALGRSPGQALIKLAQVDALFLSFL